MKNLISILVISIFFFGCKKEEIKPSPVDYKYLITGTSGSYSVTLQNVDNNVQQWSDVGQNCYYTWTQTGTRWLYLSAQNNKSSGNVTVKIYRNNIVVAENTSYGGYTIATVSGTY
jgi:hypothetical protein